MKKFLFIFVAIFLSVPVMARVCMSNNPTIVATKSDLATKASATELAVQVAILSTRIAALENQPVDLSWLSTWSNASDTLPSSSTTYDSGSQNGVWSVTAYFADSGTKTISGVSLCSETSGSHNIRGNPSETNGRNCWCKMTLPRAGAWISVGGSGMGNHVPVTDSQCATNCAHFYCANRVQTDSNVRTAVLALP